MFDLSLKVLPACKNSGAARNACLIFYSHSCPRLYELNTIAYWILEKNAHSHRFRAQINQIAQVAIELSIKRGTTSLTILKAENRQADAQYKPHKFWTKDLTITFDTQKRISGQVDLGLRLKYFRTKRGLSQTELAKLVGVTPSTISQVESNLIYPALPALMKMAEVLSVDITSFFQDQEEGKKRLIFTSVEATDLNLPELPQKGVHASFFKCLAPLYYFEKSRLNYAHEGCCREEGWLLALLSGKRKLDYSQQTATPLPSRKPVRVPARKKRVGQTMP
jgi:transcriptional regulator with XRE-family HTH domain